MLGLNEVSEVVERKVNMYIPRMISKSILERAKKSPVIGLFGPRQSGKSTLVRKLFPKHKYVNFEDLKLRSVAQQDTRAFLESYTNEYGLIIDEAQRVPEIFSYIQLVSDEDPRPGRFILTGSQNYLLMQSVSQSLAGRISLFTLLPFSMDELSRVKMLSKEYEESLFKGFYPPVIARDDDPVIWYRDYITSYVERDVRELVNIGDIVTFQRFMGLCAGRIGQLLNLSSLASDCGISHTTARKWISILETSYIVFLLPPHSRKFSKRLIKSPKLFFYDPGLACSLLGIENKTQLMKHYLRGGLFETMIVSELYKNFFNANRKPTLYFWRNQTGHEVDCIIERGQKLYPIEIKSNKSMTLVHFKGVDYWNRLANCNPEDGYVIYGGDQRFASSHGTFVPWDETYSVFEEVINQ